MAHSTNILLFPALSITKMKLLARTIAARLKAGDVLALSGEVGTGKTTFAQGLISSLAPQARATSPTFTLMQPYEVTLAAGRKDMLWHLDLYRLKHAEEAEELGLEELWPHITLIEWPEIIKRRLPPERLDIALDFGNSADTRRVAFSGVEIWRDRLKGIDESL